VSARKGQPHRNHRAVAFIEEPKATAVFALLDDNGCCDAFKAIIVSTLHHSRDYVKASMTDTMS
jgi:hypothetical protein